MGEFSGVLLIRTLIPCMKALSSRAYHLQKAPPPVPAHWGLESQHMNLGWGEPNIQFITEMNVGFRILEMKSEDIQGREDYWDKDLAL